jgi:hypothetical protein
LLMHTWPVALSKPSARDRTRGMRFDLQSSGLGIYGQEHRTAKIGLKAWSNGPSRWWRERAPRCLSYNIPNFSCFYFQLYYIHYFKMNWMF